MGRDTPPSQNSAFRQSKTTRYHQPTEKVIAGGGHEDAMRNVRGQLREPSFGLSDP